jgi:probable DNA metabolism protein
VREVVIDERWDAWRTTARALLREGVPPAHVSWRGAHDAQPMLGGLLSSGPAAPVVDAPWPEGPRVPREFVTLGERAACVRDPERWALLYRVLWRLTHGEPRLLDVVVDRDVARLVAMDKTVRRDVHKLHAFVRFRAVPITSEDVCYVAWFEPEHLILELAAPFFARRFASMLWSILTPDRSAHWDGDALTFGPGVPRAAAPDDDPLEELWRTYYANVFNPARLKPRAMRSEMPKKYWANLPEARLIPDLVSDAPRRVRAMIERLQVRDEGDR